MTRPPSTSSIQTVGDRVLDALTLQLLADRDHAFLEKLFTEINPYLIRICSSNGIHGPNAEDVIFDTWDRFFSNIEKFEGRSQIRTFICGILFNKIREHRRAIKRTTYEDDSESFMDQSFTAEGWWKHAPQDPHHLLEIKEVSLFVDECLEGLSEQQRSAFLLREVEDEPGESLGRHLGVSVAHVRVLLFRAKDKLKKCIEGKISAEVN